jgi:hypothetical protein
MIGPNREIRPVPTCLKMDVCGCAAPTARCPSKARRAGELARVGRAAGRRPTSPWQGSRRHRREEIGCHHSITRERGDTRRGHDARALTDGAGNASREPPGGRGSTLTLLFALAGQYEAGSISGRAGVGRIFPLAVAVPLRPTPLYLRSCQPAMGPSSPCIDTVDDRPNVMLR